MIKIEWGGTEKMQAALRGASQRMADLSPAMKDGAEELDKLIKDCFRKSTDPWGNPWEPLKEGTLNARRTGKNKKKPKAKILVDTGVLQNSCGATYDQTSIIFGSVYENRRNPKTGQLAAGYAAAHQFGSEKLGIKARPFLPIKNGKIEAPAGTPAGKAFAKIYRTIGSYITHGTLQAPAKRVA